MFVACVYAPVCALCMQEWKPRWGYKRVKDQKDDWMLEVPESAGRSAGVCVWHLHTSTPPTLCDLCNQGLMIFQGGGGSKARGWTNAPPPSL